MVISQFYPLRGGAEVQAQRLAYRLKKRGMKVFVLTRKIGALPGYEEIDDIPVYRKIRTIDLPFLWGIFFIVSAFIFLYQRRHEYDIIHCHIAQGFHSSVAVLFKYLFKKKVIVKMASSGETSDLKMLREIRCGRIMLRWIKNVDVIVYSILCNGWGWGWPFFWNFSRPGRGTNVYLKCGWLAILKKRLPRY